MKLARGGDWTYTANPADSDLDWVRWRIGDTDESEPLQSDQEIAAALASESSRSLAAALVCDAIAAQFRKAFAFTVADGAGNNRTEQRQQRVAHYSALAAELRAEYARDGGGAGVPFAGGISKADNDSRASNTDRASGSFYLGMQDACE